MFDKTSISQKDAQGAFRKTSSPFVAIFKVGASLFLMFLFDCFEFFCLFIVDPFMLFDLHNRERNNSSSAFWLPWTHIIHCVHPNGVLHHLMLNFPAELQIPIWKRRVHLSHSQVPRNISIGSELILPCPLNWNRSMSSMVVVIYMVALA